MHGMSDKSVCKKINKKLLIGTIKCNMSRAEALVALFKNYS